MAMLSNNNLTTLTCFRGTCERFYPCHHTLTTFFGTQTSCSLYLLWNLKKITVFVSYLKDPNLGYVIGTVICKRSTNSFYYVNQDKHMYLNNCITLLDQLEQDLTDQLGHMSQSKTVSADVSVRVVLL